MYKRWKCECAPISRSIFEPTCIFSLLYTVPKISSISYPYQCLFAPSAQKGMGREKILMFGQVQNLSTVPAFRHHVFTMKIRSFLAYFKKYDVLHLVLRRLGSTSTSRAPTNPDFGFWEYFGKLMLLVNCHVLRKIYILWQLSLVVMETCNCPWKLDRPQGNR